MAKLKLDETDHKILDMLIENTRIPFTDISKKLNISAHILIFVCYNKIDLQLRSDAINRVTLTLCRAG